MATVAITPNQDVITGEIFIAAPPARVFQAITDPQQMPRWWGASDMYRITDWKADVRVGGKWSSDGVGHGFEPRLEELVDWVLELVPELGIVLKPANQQSEIFSIGSSITCSLRGRRARTRR